MSEVISVTFLKGWSIYNAKETAGFNPHTAKDLVLNKKVAKFTDPAIQAKFIVVESDDKQKKEGDETKSSSEFNPARILDANAADIKLIIAAKDKDGEFIVSDDELLILSNTEKAGKNRKGVNSDIENALLSRVEGSITGN